MSRRPKVRRLKYTYLVIATGEDDAGTPVFQFLQFDAARLPDNVKAALTKGNMVAADAACRYPDASWVFSFGGTYEYLPDFFGDCHEVYINDVGMVFAALCCFQHRGDDSMVVNPLKAELIQQGRTVLGPPGSKKRVEVWLPFDAAITFQRDGKMSFPQEWLPEEVVQMIARNTLRTRGQGMPDDSVEFELSDCVLVLRQLPPWSAL